MKKEVAGFTRRAFAYIIDILILKFLILKPFDPFINNFKLNISTAFSKEMLIVSFSIGILSLLYWALLELTVRQSIGKMITRIYVTSTTKQFTLQQALLRNLSKIVTIVLVFDVLYALVKKTHQRYFEILSKTEVLKIKEKWEELSQ